MYDVRPSDAQRALLLLEEYRTKLNNTEDRQLRHSIQRVIEIFQSNLFQALIGTHRFLSFTLVILKSYFIFPDVVRCLCLEILPAMQ